MLGKIKVLIEKIPQTEYPTTEHPLRIVYTGDFPAGEEVFELLKNILSENRMSIKNEGEINIATFSLLLLLSGFIHEPAFPGIIRRSVKLSVKYKVYNLLYTEPDRQWKLNDVSSAIFMSASTLKRKLASEGTGFAPIFPDICYHLTHYKPAAADIPVASDNPAHYADAIRYNARTPLQGSLLPLTRLVWA